MFQRVLMRLTMQSGTRRIASSVKFACRPFLFERRQSLDNDENFDFVDEIGRLRRLHRLDSFAANLD
jgi:hypothetical protein